MKSLYYSYDKRLFLLKLYMSYFVDSKQKYNFAQFTHYLFNYGYWTYIYKSDGYITCHKSGEIDIKTLEKNPKRINIRSCVSYIFDIDVSSEDLILLENYYNLHNLNNKTNE